MDTIALTRWYRENYRRLPWRETKDPYLIWLSEVILQQTRVAQGLDYYNRFAARFPDVRELAAASQDEILHLWQGLGYYSRARNLHAAARQVVDQHGGIFPTEYDKVRALKGVGDYTAAAVCSVAANDPHAVVDGNVYRVLARLLDIATPIDSTAGKKEFAAAAQESMESHLALRPDEAGVYNQAVMELGATLCAPRNPQCGACPVAENCLARERGTVALRPRKQGKTRQTPRYFNYLHLTDSEGRTLLTRREGKDIWQGLYEFPLVETTQAVDFDRLRQEPAFGKLMESLLPGGEPYTLRKSVPMPKHLLSHRIIHGVFHRIELPGPFPELLPEGTIPLPGREIGRYAVSRLTGLYLEGLAGREGMLFPQ